jgi:hypothetical protein
VQPNALLDASNPFLYSFRVPASENHSQGNHLLSFDTAEGLVWKAIDWVTTNFIEHITVCAQPREV